MHNSARHIIIYKLLYPLQYFLYERDETWHGYKDDQGINVNKSFGFKIMTCKLLVFAVINMTILIF